MLNHWFTCAIISDKLWNENSPNRILHPLLALRPRREQTLTAASPSRGPPRAATSQTSPRAPTRRSWTPSAKRMRTTACPPGPRLQRKQRGRTTTSSPAKTTLAPRKPTTPRRSSTRRAAPVRRRLASAQTSWRRKTRIQGCGPATAPRVRPWRRPAER